MHDAPLRPWEGTNQITVESPEEREAKLAREPLSLRLDNLAAMLMGGTATIEPTVELIVKAVAALKRLETGSEQRRIAVDALVHAGCVSDGCEPSHASETLSRVRHILYQAVAQIAALNGIGIGWGEPPAAASSVKVTEAVGAIYEGNNETEGYIKLDETADRFSLDMADCSPPEARATGDADDGPRGRFRITVEWWREEVKP